MRFSFGKHSPRVVFPWLISHLSTFSPRRPAIVRARGINILGATWRQIAFRQASMRFCISGEATGFNGGNSMMNDEMEVGDMRSRTSFMLASPAVIVMTIPPSKRRRIPDENRGSGRMPSKSDRWRSMVSAICMRDNPAGMLMCSSPLTHRAESLDEPLRSTTEISPSDGWLMRSEFIHLVLKCPKGVLYEGYR